MMAAPIEKRNSRDEHVDTVVDDEKSYGFSAQEPGADYSGAVRKTDPEEIRLVRKLDWMIMVCNCHSETSHPPYIC
jgi:hypothetical protein